MKAMLFAAGLGTRLKPFTDKHPKALLPISHSTLLQHNIQYLQQYGINNIVINVHHFADQIETYIKNNHQFGASIQISDERGELLETGGGLWKAQEFFNDSEDILVLNSDIITNYPLSTFIQKHLENKPIASLCVSNRTSSRLLVFDENDDLTGWKNFKTNETKGNIPTGLASMKAFNGIHIINRAIFDLLNFSGKCSLIDVYMQLCTQKKSIIKGIDASVFEFIDAGKWENLKAAEKIINQLNNNL